MNQKLTSKELLKLEKEMYDYQGDDRIVSSHELAKELDQTKDVVLSFKTGIPSMDRILEDIEAGELIVITGPSGEGKCLGAGTNVLMFDGSYRNVEDILKNEYLMGPDSKPRKVLSTTKGQDEMFEICQVKGENYTVNSDHILVLRNGSKPKVGRLNPKVGDTIEISVKDYVNKSNSFKNKYKGFKVSLDFKAKSVLLDPYFLGLWLGDGHSMACRITTMDEEVVEYLKKFVLTENCRISVTKQPNNKSNVYNLSGLGWRNNSILDRMKKLGVLGNKNIPSIYKFNSRNIRLELLAGLIDSDGYVNHGGYVFVNKNEEMARDVAFIARSLGFYAYISPFENYGGVYWKVGISGDCSIVPVKIKRKIVPKRKQIKNILNTGIKVKSIGDGKYYGFKIDGDGRFLLADLTVTHNTTIIFKRRNISIEP